MNSLRIVPEGKRLAILVDAENVVARMKRVWEDVSRDSRGIVYRDVVVDPGELVRTASALREAPGQRIAAGVFTCKDCGVVGCTGVDAVEVTNDGYEVHWSIPAVALEAAPLTFTFDPAQYFREIARAEKALPKAPSRAARNAAKRARTKTVRAERVKKAGLRTKRAKAGRPAKKRAAKTTAKKAAPRGRRRR